MAQRYIIKRRSRFQRLIRISGMWRKQNRMFKGVSWRSKIPFMWRSACSVMKNYKIKV